MKTNLKRGFGPIAIIVVIAILLVAGGGIYYSKHKNKPALEGNSDIQANSNSTVQTGTLRSLLAIGRDVMCTYNETNASGEVSGTTYISGNMMRSDITTASASGAEVDSHMIKQGDMMFSWTGNQGVKMNSSAMGANSSTETQSSLNLDQNINYKCVDWTKDESKFSLPTGVNFIDTNAMMHIQSGTSANAPIPVPPIPNSY